MDRLLVNDPLPREPIEPGDSWHAPGGGLPPKSAQGALLGTFLGKKTCQKCKKELPQSTRKSLGVLGTPPLGP